MISVDTRREWAKAAHHYAAEKNGRDFTAEISDMSRYLSGLFNRKALKHIHDENLGQNIDKVIYVLEEDSDKEGYVNRQEAAVLLAALQAHMEGEIKIPKMKLNIMDGVMP